MLQVPRRLLPSPRLVSVDRRRAGVHPDDPALRVYRAFVTELLAVSDDLTGESLEEMGVTAVDLLVSVLRRGGADEPGREGGGSATRAAMQALVRAHLGDPELGPDFLAAAHRVSVRYVHRLFAESGTTPAAFIRAERLRWARRLLAEPRSGQLPVAVVAARVGFTSTDGFIRAFRRSEGTTPATWRREASARTPGS